MWITLVGLLVMNLTTARVQQRRSRWSQAILSPSSTACVPAPAFVFWLLLRPLLTIGGFRRKGLSALSLKRFRGSSRSWPPREGEVLHGDTPGMVKRSRNRNEKGISTNKVQVCTGRIGNTVALSFFVP